MSCPKSPEPTNMFPYTANGKQGFEPSGLEKGSDPGGPDGITRVLISGRGRQESQCLSDLI